MEKNDEMVDELVLAVRAAAATGRVQRIGVRGESQTAIRGASGLEYAGIGGFDTSDDTAATDLLLLTADDLEQQGYPKPSVSALLAHRTRKLREAIREGVFSAEQLEAMEEAGFLVLSAD